MMSEGKARRNYRALADTERPRHQPRDQVFEVGSISSILVRSLQYGASQRKFALNLTANAYHE